MPPSPKFWDRIARRYAKSPVPDEQAYRKKLEVTRHYFRPDTEVLELGCGTGSTAIAHAPYVKHIRATDISSRMLEIARGKAEAAGVGNVTFEQSPVEELAVADGAFGAVLGLNVLHLVEDIDETIARVYAMLEPGGVFVSSTPCFANAMKLLKVALALGHFLRLLPRVSFFPEQALEDSLTGAGFRIDHRWQPAEGKPVFIVAKKPGEQPRARDTRRGGISTIISADRLDNLRAMAEAI